MGARISGVSQMAKWVYSFGDGEAEGKAEMRNLLGGKGANLAEMANLGLPVPPGFTITTEVCTHYYAERPELPARPRRAEVERRARRHRADHRQDARRRRAPAPSLGALRRPRLDAGNDGHHPQSRPQRPDGRGARGERRQALRLRFLPPLHPDVFRRRARHRPPRASRSGSRTSRTSAATPSTPTSPATTGRSWSATTRSSSSASAARRFPRIRRPSSGARSARSSSPG